MIYRILTNNEKIKELTEECSLCDIQFLNTDVQGVLRSCQNVLEQGEFCLAADPMGGRRARPFPWLTVILKKTDGEVPARDWERIMQYALLDQQRKETYVGYDDAMKEDFRVLDCSLTRAALGRR